MGLYSRLVFPRLCELALDRPAVACHRKTVLAPASGEILEIGIGTGLNLPHYPDGVRKITAIDPNSGMHRKARARIAASGRQVDQRLLGSEALPFDTASFDCVVSTFTLCSIGQVERALAEMHRVLKPGGRLLLLEHGLSREPRVRTWQRRLNWLQRTLADNCHLDRDIRRLVEQQAFGSVKLDEFYLESTPKTHGYLYLGWAEK